MKITYKNSQYSALTGETVLDTLLRHEVAVPYSCKAGVCNVCVMAGDHQEHSISATNGLKNTLVRQGYFRACQSITSQDIKLQDTENVSLFSPASVMEKDFLAPDVCRIRVRPATDLFYHAGQYLNIRMPNGEIRSYSLASLPTQDEYLEFHIRKMENGIVSSWLFDDLDVGQKLDIQGPFGDCFYLPENENGDILMIGTGTGLAPLVGILRDAISSGHNGRIQIYHGGRTEPDLYMHKPLLELSNTFKNFQYFPCLSKPSAPLEDTMFSSLASDLAFFNNENLKGSLVYLCGSPQMVKTARRKAYLLGADMKQIYVDPFITKNLRGGELETSLPASIGNDRRNRL